GSIGQWLSGLFWLGTCIVGSYFAMAYDFKPGSVGPQRGSWPSESHIAWNPGKTTVVAFLHPRCGCTRATVKQLIRTLKANPQAELVAVVFVHPDSNQADDWQEGEYVRTIRSEVPGAR